MVSWIFASVSRSTEALKKRSANTTFSHLRPTYVASSRTRRKGQCSTEGERVIVLTNDLAILHQRTGKAEQTTFADAQVCALALYDGV